MSSSQGLQRQDWEFWHFFLFFFTLLFFSVSLLADEPSPLSKAQKAWIAQHPVVTLGADYNWPPYDFVDEAGHHAGIAADLLKILSKKSGLQFKVETDVWAKTLEKAKQGKVQGLTCAVATPERKKYLNFTQPYLSMPLAVVVQNERQDIHRFEDLKGKKVAVNRGSYLHEWLKMHHPDIPLFLTSSNQAALEAVAFGKADAYIGNIAVATYLMKHHFLTNLKMIDKVPDLETKVSIAVVKSEPALFDILDTLVKTITPEEHQQILEKWVKASDLNFSAPSHIIHNTELTPAEKQWIQAHPKIIVGGGPDWAPVDFVANGQYQGIAKDYLDLISQKTGLHFKVVVDKWVNNLKKIKAHQIDMLDAVYYRPERTEFMLFTAPYFELVDYFFIRKGVQARSISDLFGKTVAMPRGYAHGDILKAEFPEMKILWVDTFQQAVDAVAKGQADVLFDTFASISYVLEQQGIRNIVPFQAYRGKEANKIHMTTTLDNVTLRNILDKGLAAITPEEHRKIRQKWLAPKPDYSLFYQIAAGMTLLLLIFLFWNRKLALEIAKRKQVEASLLETQKALEAETQKALAASQAKSEFLSNMSHEIRTPMNAILGFTELLSEEVKEPKLKGYIKTIQKAGSTLLTLINDVLDLSKIEAGKLTIETHPTDVQKLVEELAEVFHLQVEKKGLDFLVEVDPNLPNGLLLDDVRLRQILLNLLGNAVKFTAQGHIALKVHADNVDEHLSKLDLIIQVEDTGIGIPKDQLDKVFAQFEQVSGQDTRQYGGTGLGLAISSKLAKMMGGELTVESEAGKGATFTLKLPQVDIAAVKEVHRVQQAVGQIQQTIHFLPAKLLVVDDVADNLDLIVKIFADTPVEVLTAHHGKEAIEQFHRVQPDAILMDIRMPVMDGIEAAKRIKAMAPELPIIALTASVMAEETDSLAQPEVSHYFDAFLRKPILRAELFQTLAQFLPHEVKHIESTITEIDDWRQMPEVQAKWSEIQPYIEQKLQPLMQKANQTHNMTDIEAFAATLHQFAKAYQIQPLEQLATQLQTAVDSFDIAAIEGLMQKIAAQLNMESS